MGPEIDHRILGERIGANEQHVFLHRRSGDDQIGLFAVIDSFAQGEGGVLRGAALLRHLCLHKLLGGGQRPIRTAAIGKKVEYPPLGGCRNGDGNNQQNGKGDNQTGR